MKKTTLSALASALFLFVFLAPVQNLSAAQFTQQDFTSQSYCGTCHRAIYEQWQLSLHSQAFSDPVFSSVLALAITDMGGKDSDGGKLIQDYCLHCHTPIASMTGDMPPTTALSTNAISCDFCHTVSDVGGVGNGSFISSPGTVKRGPFKDAVSPAHETAYSELHTRSEFCGMCHDVYHPVNGLPLETTYTEWKQSSYAEEGKTCQHCMMGTVNNARAAGNGPVRPLIKTHEFTGANVTLGKASVAESHLRQAAALELKANKRNADPDEKIKLTIGVTNKGAGHKIPTGLTEVREMWLEVKAIDSDNVERMIFKEVYNTVLEDDKGIHDGHVPVWRAAKIYSDNRIGPKETRTYKKNFVVPKGSGGVMKIVAVLKYRSASPSLTEKLGFDDFPVIEMAKTEKEIEITDTGSLASPCRLLSVILMGAIAAVIGGSFALRVRHSD